MRQARLQDLDILRGIAACCVLLFHFTVSTDHHHLWPFQVPWGHFGVELFFVISGFVILMTLERSGNIKKFLISRVTRLYPAYWCVVLFTACVLGVLSPATAPLVAVVGDLTMLQAFMRVASLDPSYWTLTAELIFYAAIVSWFRFRSARWPEIEWYCLGWIGVATVIRTMLSIKHADMPGIYATPLLLYYGQFFIIGICLYRIYIKSAGTQTGVTFVAAILLSLFGGGPTSLSPGPLAYFLVTGSVTTLVFLASRSWLAFLRNPVLLFLGDISYPLYLVHQRVGEEFLNLAYAHQLPAWLSIPLVLAVLLGIAWLIHQYVEVPARTVLRAKLQQLSASGLESGAAT
jgi:peptidoglycan/LPS O-acetylase OafA/YrhL